MSMYDVVVVGAGPAGLTAALYMARFEVSVALVEKLSPGGQILMTHMIENYPGFPEGVEGWKLADTLNDHLGKYKLDRFNDEVRQMELEPGKHRLLVGDAWIEAKSVILCTGAEYKRLGLPGEKELLGKGVSYCALCDGNFFRGQTVAVIGGGNSALEEALYLAKLVKKLYLIHRRDDFRAQRCIQDRCEVNQTIHILRSSVVSEIQGADKVEGILVKNVKTGEEQRLDVDGVFIFVGHQPQGQSLPAELARDKDGFLVTDAEMRTNIEGVFAAGDIRSKATRQVATAVGDGATAANVCHAYLESLHGPSK